MPQQPLTIGELQELAADPRLHEVMPLLSAQERAAVEKFRGADADPERSTVDTIGDVARGGVKGLGETIFRLGQVVHGIPGLGDLTDIIARAVGPEGTDPDAFFSQVPSVLEATNTAERVGKGVEQVGEFLIPASPARLAAIKGLVKLIPDNLGPEAMRVANKIMTQLGRAGGEAGSAAGVAALQGEEQPERAAAWAAGGHGVGEIAAQAARLLKTPFGQQFAPFLAAVAALQGAGGLTPPGVASTIGAFGLARGAAKQALSSPTAISTMQRTARTAGDVGGRLAAGTATELRKRRPEGSR